MSETGSFIAPLVDIAPDYRKLRDNERRDHAWPLLGDPPEDRRCTHTKRFYDVVYSLDMPPRVPPGPRPPVGGGPRPPVGGGPRPPVGGGPFPPVGGGPFPPRPTHWPGAVYVPPPSNYLTNTFWGLWNNYALNGADPGVALLGPLQLNWEPDGVLTGLTWSGPADSGGCAHWILILPNLNMRLVKYQPDGINIAIELDGYIRLDPSLQIFTWHLSTGESRDWNRIG